MDDLCYLCLGAPATISVKGYAIGICERCWRNACDGWPRQMEPALLSALDRAGLLIPDRNEQGLYPREYAPPADFNL